MPHWRRLPCREDEFRDRVDRDRINHICPCINDALSPPRLLGLLSVLFILYLCGLQPVPDCALQHILVTRCWPVSPCAASISTGRRVAGCDGKYTHRTAASPSQ